MSEDTVLETIEDKSVVATATLEEYQADRDKMLGFVNDKLQEGVDFGEMYEGAKKPSLLKPGAEKVCILLQIEPVFVADRDTWTMMGKQSGHVNLVCYLLNQERKLRALKMIKELGKENEATIFKMLAIAEGRGAGYLNEKKTTNDNSLIKIVEKRSLVDAVLRVAGLSEMYTQDGEDTPAVTPGATPGATPEATPEVKPPPSSSASGHSKEWRDLYDAMCVMMNDNDWHGTIGKNDLDSIKLHLASITAKMDIGSMNRTYDSYKLLLDTAKKQHGAANAPV